MSAARLDRAVVAAGLADSRARAQALIRAGAVSVDGQVQIRPATPVDPRACIVLTANPLPHVSRAGLKLAHALAQFGLSPQGAVTADLGASTGGFTQVLLDAGAAHVHAVDVGHGQMHPRIAADTRVTLHEGINARALPPGLLPALDWVVADLSFISLTLALPGALALARPGAVLVALVKPQFEVGPANVGKGGIVTDPAARTAACARIAAFLADRGWQVTGQADSPITGGDGNREYLICARKVG